MAAWRGRMITLCVINSPSSSKRFCYWFLDHREANLAMKAEVDFCLTAAPSAMDSRLRWVQKDSSWSPGRQTEDVPPQGLKCVPKAPNQPRTSHFSHQSWCGWVGYPSLWVPSAQAGLAAHAELGLAVTCQQHQPPHQSPLGNGVLLALRKAQPCSWG